MGRTTWDKLTFGSVNEKKEKKKKRKRKESIDDEYGNKI